jgi:DNA-binding beta-propeller fold protein YncE
MRLLNRLALLLITAVPLVAEAQSVSLRPEPGWPSGAKDAPDYGTAAISAVAAAPNGNLYVFQRTPNPVLVFDRSGRFVRSWGMGQFPFPHGCRFDPQGNLWFTDIGDHVVVEYSPEGKLLMTLGTKGATGEDGTHFNKPADVAFAPNGDIYIADGYGNSRVARFSRDGKYLGSWGKKGAGPGEFNLPHSIVVDPQGRVIVADRENVRIQVFSADGKFLKEWNDGVHPYGMFLTREGRLWVTDGVDNTLSVYDLEGRRLGRWGAKGSEPGQFQLPHLLTVDDRGAVYVAEVTGKRLQKFTP